MRCPKIDQAIICFLLVAGSVMISCHTCSAQSPDRKQVAGRYVHETGQPARTISGEDGSEASIQAIIYSRSVLHLRRSGTSKECHTPLQGDLPYCYKSRWYLQDDSVVIRHGDTITTYLWSENTLTGTNSDQSWHRTSE